MYKIADVFSEDSSIYKGNPISISLNPSVKSIQLKAKNIQFALKSNIGNELQHLTELNISEQLEFPEWMTSIFSILKPNGEVRLCGD